MSEARQSEHRAGETVHGGGRRSGIAFLLRLVLVLLLFAGAAVFFAWLVARSEVESMKFGPYVEAGDGCCLEEQGGRLRYAVEAYWAKHGRYPTDLIEAGVAPADTRTKFGDWDWRYYGAGALNVLSVGDYGSNNFALWWSPGMKDWYWDT